MDEIRQITRRILFVVNAVIASGAFILKIINPVVVSYTEEIRRADLINFTVFTPIIMVILSIWLHRLFDPLRAMAGDPNPGAEQTQRLRMEAFNMPIKIMFWFNVIILSVVAFVALGVDAVMFKFYPLYKRIISMGLIWSYTICSSLAIYIYAKRLMIPILKSTSGSGRDEGYRVSIRTNIIVTTLMLLMTIVLFLSVYGYSQAREATLYDSEEAARDLLDTVGNMAAESGSLEKIREYIELTHSDVKVFVADSEGNFLTDRPDIVPDTADIRKIIPAGYGDAVSPDNKTHVVVKLLPLERPFKGLFAGAAYGLSPAATEKIRYMTYFLVFIGGFFAIFATVIGYYVANDTSMTIKDIDRRMKEISGEEFLYKEIEVISQDEVGDLTRTFNNLQRTLQSNLKRHLLRYHHHEVVEEIIKGRASLDVREKIITILFTDITDFTRLSEELGPTRTAALLNEYFDLVTEAVFRYKGSIDKFIGDAAMAVFGAPFDDNNFTEMAVRAAIDIQKGIRELNKYEVSIGINTGYAVIGNIGSSKRMEYTAIGDTVNVAARLQKMAGPGRIFIGETTYAKVKDFFETRPVAMQKVKGKNAEFSIYEVLFHFP